jgi:hypothetical protein
MTTIILAVGIFGIFFIFMCVRLIFLKDGEFKGTCATQNPALMEKGIDCGCGKKAGTCDAAMAEKSALVK